MNFAEIAARFERAESGSDAFKHLSKDAFALMSDDVENAGLFFVIGVAAHSYVNIYEDQGVSGEFSDRAKAILVGFNSKIIQGLAADAQTRLTLLGEVAAEYQLRVSEF